MGRLDREAKYHGLSTEAGALAGSIPAFGLALYRAPIDPDRYRGVCLMLSVPTTGVRAENCMAVMLHKARIRNASPDFNADNLRSVAQIVDPIRYAKCDKHIVLHKCKADQILDCVYGVDHVIDMGESVYVGIDLTLDASKVSSKVSKAQSLTKLRAAVGIRQFFVVHMIGDLRYPNQATIQQSMDSLWDAMEASLNGRPDQTRALRFYVS